MVLTELGIEGWTGAAVLAAKSGGGARSESGKKLAVRAARGSSRRLDSLDRRVAALRSKTGVSGARETPAA